MKVSDGAVSALQGVCNNASKAAPAVGRVVGIVRGREQGRHGRVFWHGKDRYAEDWGGNWLQQSLHQAMGRIGFRIGVEEEDGTRFFTKACYAIVCLEGENDEDVASEE